MATIGRAVSCCAVLAWLPMWHVGAAVNLQVTPLRGLVDEPFIVRVEGAKPGASVRVQAELSDDDGRTWTAVGEYSADAAGVVDTSSAASAGGTYQGVLPGGLACSALPVPSNELDRYIAELSEQPGPTTPKVGTQNSFKVRVSAQTGGKTFGPIDVTREYLTSGAAASEVDAGRVKGIYFEPPAGPRGVPVVVLGGSGGGVQRAGAMLLASRGHPALALAYFAYGDLPPQLLNIPLETFSEGAAWLTRKTGAQGIVLMGTSRGSEAVMLTAAHLPENTAGVVAIVPSPLVHAAFGKNIAPGQTLFAWTLGDRGVPPVRSAKLTNDAWRAREQERAAASQGPPGYSGTPYFLANWRDPIAHELYGIPVEKIRVPLLLLGGEADTMWPSALGVRQINERMAAHGKEQLVEAHTYDDAGHSLSRVGIGNAMSSFSVHAVSRQWVSTGGKPEANCRAGYAAWSHILTFLGKLSATPQKSNKS